ncbi:hypothetical protein FRC07_014117, partial [Ceratobasidium sp. 392]
MLSRQPNQQKRGRNEPEPMVICNHCGLPHTERDVRRHRKLVLAELQYLADVGHSEPPPTNEVPMGIEEPEDGPLANNNNNARNVMECVIEQITRSALVRPHQSHSTLNEVNDEWYLHDHDDDKDNDLFGRPNTHGLDWDTLPEEPPLSDPFAGMTEEEILGLSFAREMMSEVDYSLFTERDRYILDCFNFRVSTRISSQAFHDLRYAFPGRLDNMPSLFEIQTRVLGLSGLAPVMYDCCHDSCVCYTDQYADLQACPLCKAPRFYANGKPAK